MHLRQETRQKQKPIQTIDITDAHSMCQNAEACAKKMVKDHKNGKCMLTALSKMEDSIFKQEVKWNMDWHFAMTS